MRFPRSDRPLKPSRDAGPVLAIGRQAFINGSGDPDARVSLFDEKGTAVLNSLINGAEVEIVAWKPRGSATRYLVRSIRHDVTGWLGADQLRTTRQPRSGAVAETRPIAAVWIPPRRSNGLRRKVGTQQSRS